VGQIRIVDTDGKQLRIYGCGSKDIAPNAKVPNDLTTLGRFHQTLFAKQKYAAAQCLPRKKDYRSISPTKSCRQKHVKLL
jgi:hypothetical protein